MRARMRRFSLISITAVQRREGAWRKLYKRLLARLCPDDERQPAYPKGKSRVIMRIAGHMIEVVYTFLTCGATLLAQVSLGQKPPPSERFLSHCPSRSSSSPPFARCWTSPHVQMAVDHR